MSIELNVENALRRIKLVPTSDSVFFGKRPQTADVQCAKFRRLVQNVSRNFALNKLDKLYSNIEKRMAVMNIEGVHKLEQNESFRRKIQRDDTFTYGFSHIPIQQYENPWVKALSLHDVINIDESYWWQITKLSPETNFGDFRLYSIEINYLIAKENHIRRSDYYSQFSRFAFTFAKDDEIYGLKNVLETSSLIN